MTHPRASYSRLAASRGWSTWSCDGSQHPWSPSLGSGSRGSWRAGLGYPGRGFQQEGVAHRITDRPRFFLQRKASTMSVSCATRCSTPRPSSSVTSSSTALRAWEAPSNAPCASQVGVPGGEQVGRGKGPRSPALQALGSVPGAVWLQSSWRTP